jgi:hypothetical protein
MERTYTSLKRAAAGAIVVAALVGQLPASAQEAVTTESTSATLAKKAPRTTATPEMITDAIERSQSRTERNKLYGIPERFGSEDPARFTIKE